MSPEDQHIHNIVDPQIAQLRNELNEFKKTQIQKTDLKEFILTVLDAYQVYCQQQYNTGTIPDSSEWFAKNYPFI